MGDYISRDMAIARLTKVEVTNRLATMTDAKREIAEMPAADVAPVVLGHWKKDRDTIKCTVCGFGMFPNRYTFMHGVCVTDKKLPKYCENCGAKMGTAEEQSV